MKFFVAVSYVDMATELRNWSVDTGGGSSKQEALVSLNKFRKANGCDSPLLEADFYLEVEREAPTVPITVTA